MEDLRRRLIDEFTRISTDESLAEVHRLLRQNGLFIELTYETDTHSNDEVPFGYIYDGKLIETRQELKSLLAGTSPIGSVTRKELAKDISAISRKLNTLYARGIFDAVEQVVDSTLEQWWQRRASGQVVGGIYPYVTMRVNGIQVLGFDYLEHEDDIDGGVTDEQEILNLLAVDTDLVRIPDQGWFKKLCSQSQYLIRAGTQLLERVYTQEDSGTLLDFSPLLLDFVKAVEIETNQHYQEHQRELIELSKTIVEKVPPPEYGAKAMKEIQGLLSIANDIIRFKDRFTSSGTKTIFYLLKYYGLGEGLNFLPNSYLGSAKRAELLKDKSVIDRLQDLSIGRNRFVHAKVIDSQMEFMMHYHDLLLALRLLAILK